MTEIQAVIFKKNNYTPTKARSWLDKNKIPRKKKVHKTKNYLRYRVEDPKKYSKYATKSINKNVKLILGKK
jgi:hypothetical protein